MDGIQASAQTFLTLVQMLQVSPTVMAASVALASLVQRPSVIFILAIAVLIFLGVLPITFYNIRSIRAERNN